ncbi:MAG: hypothetical protein IKH65_08880 [Clostridia bacterium]|nr:hypothetical protein [Clostridia bacterium]
MKIKRLSKMIISSVLAFCLISCVFVPSVFAVNHNADLLLGVCSQWIYASDDRFLTIQLDPKFVTVTDSFELYLQYYPMHSGDTLDIKKVPKEDYVIERKNIDGIEHFAIFVHFISYSGYLKFHILKNSLEDADGNGNPQISYFPNTSGDTLYSYKKYDGDYFVDASYGTLSLTQGDKIRFSMRGPYSDEYKVYIDDNLISQGPTVFDITFDNAGEHTLKIYLNEILNTELPVSVSSKAQAKQEDLKHSFELLGEGLRVLPLGILFSFNPLTLLPAGAIFSGIIEGIAGIFKAIFVW